LIATFQSPSLDSINYWFLKKSINLYGEALVKTMGDKVKNTASTDSGVDVIRTFWAGKGIEKSSLKIIDGSGLSPANRVTAKSIGAGIAICKKAIMVPIFLQCAA
jgi:D-alanyl-D-alanine carboxypeptidase/D-alanyl-D-alanine-endopeptidase (penicillin-binding protein 4)